MALVQLIIASRAYGWVLIRDGHEVGRYSAFAEAREMATTIARQASLAGDECELLIHDTDWHEEPCNEPHRPPL